MTLVVTPTPVTGVILGASATGWSHTGDTVEAKVTSVAIPAGVMGSSGQLEIEAYWSMPNNGNTKSTFIRFGAANDLTGTAYLTPGMTTVVGLNTYTRIANKTASSQVAFAANTNASFSQTTQAQITSSVDTSAVSYVVFSVQCAVNTDTTKLESYVVRLIPGV